MRVLLVAAGIVAIATFGSLLNAKASGWGPARGAMLKKGETIAIACANKKTDEGYVCLSFSCVKSEYRGGILYAGGAHFDDTITFAAGGRTVALPLGPITIDAAGENRAFLGDLAGFASLLA